MIYLALLPSLFLLLNVIHRRNHYMPPEQRLLRRLQLCTVVICTTIVMVAMWGKR